MICQPQVLVIVLFAVSNQVCFEIPVELETEAVTMMLPELQTLWVEVPRVFSRPVALVNSIALPKTYHSRRSHPIVK